MDLLENKYLFNLANGAVGSKSHESDTTFDLALEIESAHICAAFPIFIHQGGDELAFAGKQFDLDHPRILDKGDYIEFFLNRVWHDLKLVINNLLDAGPAAAEIFRYIWNVLKKTISLDRGFIDDGLRLHDLLHNPLATRTVVNECVTFH